MNKEKLYMCFVDLEKAFDRVPRKVLEWAMRKRAIPEAMVRAVMSLYEGAKTRVRIGLELSEEFEVKVGVHQGNYLHVQNIHVSAVMLRLLYKHLKKH